MTAERVAESYRIFARVEAHGESAVYEEWALGVADDPEVAAMIARLPEAKRQPNLVFAAARAAGARATGYATFGPWLRSRWADVAPIVLERSTQTNEVARSVAVLAALDGVKGPFALLEVGASAGLLLHPDRLRYRFATDAGAVVLGPEAGVTVDCAWSGGPVPASVPDVVWRAGIDTAPLDVADPCDAAWLEALVWPEQGDRRRRLRAAIQQARSDPPTLLRGDAVGSLEALASTAPADARLVVLHSAVLCYLTEPARRAFVDVVQRLDTTWVAVEGPRVLPELTARLPSDVRLERDFVVARDGKPVGTMGPHGQRFHRLGLHTPASERGPRPAAGARPSSRQGRIELPGPAVAAGPRTSAPDERQGGTGSRSGPTLT